MRRCTTFMPLVFLLAAFPAASRADVDFPQYCIQRMWLASEGECENIYECLVFDPDCTVIPQEILYYGCPEVGMPQDCEECLTSGSAKASASIPGHGKNLTAENAVQYVESRLKRAKKSQADLEWGTPRFIQISRSQLPKELNATRDLAVVDVPMLPMAKKQRSKVTDFCLEVDSLKGAKVTPVQIEKVEKGPGRQLTVAYKLGREKHKALVWLK